ncbi:MAG: hypothetical protein H6850_02480 [Alphaproteobacteria bacterium]|nr:MAG: hypothetical protein H6850_02480 [Alphaproteobacteria bacterium]
MNALFLYMFASTTGSYHPRSSFAGSSAPTLRQDPNLNFTIDGLAGRIARYPGRKLDFIEGLSIENLQLVAARYKDDKDIQRFVIDQLRELGEGEDEDNNLHSLSRAENIASLPPTTLEDDSNPSLIIAKLKAENEDLKRKAVEPTPSFSPERKKLQQLNANTSSENQHLREKIAELEVATSEAQKQLELERQDSRLKQEAAQKRAQERSIERNRDFSKIQEASKAQTSALKAKLEILEREQEKASQEKLRLTQEKNALQEKLDEVKIELGMSQDQLAEKDAHELSVSNELRETRARERENTILLDGLRKKIQDEYSPQRKRSAEEVVRLKAENEALRDVKAQTVEQDTQDQAVFDQLNSAIGERVEALTPKGMDSLEALDRVNLFFSIILDLIKNDQTSQGVTESRIKTQWAGAIVKAKKLCGLTLSATEKSVPEFNHSRSGVSKIFDDAQTEVQKIVRASAERKASAKSTASFATAATALHKSSSTAPKTRSAADTE